MLVVIPFHAGDKALAVRLANWIKSLGTVERHQCLVIHSKFTNAQGVIEPLKECFRHVIGFAPPDDANGNAGKSLLFRRALRQIQHSNAGPFLWLEPDAVPTRPGWLDAIEAEWQEKPERTHFVGSYAQLGSGGYMHAVGVYPQDADNYAPLLVFAEHNAFDQNAGAQTTKHLHASTLFANVPGSVWTPDNPALIFHPAKADADVWGVLERARDSGLLPAVVVERKAKPSTPSAPAARPDLSSPMTGPDPALSAAIMKAGGEEVQAEPVLQAAGGGRRVEPGLAAKVTVPPIPNAMPLPGTPATAPAPAPMVVAPPVSPATAPAVTAPKAEEKPVAGQPAPGNGHSAQPAELTHYLNISTGQPDGATVEEIEGFVDRMARHLQLIAQSSDGSRKAVTAKLRQFGLVPKQQPVKGAGSKRK